MNQKLRNSFVAAGMFLLPAMGYSQQLGGTTADSKMRGGSSNSAMGGLYSPNLYDGTANINIPIYQYSAEGGEYGISLSYNTRGVKVDQLAGPVGLNFALVAGFSIQRVVKDVPDDIYAENYNEIYEGTTILVNPEKKIRGRLFVYGETATEAAEDSVYRDAESDDYIVSAGGLSFTFNLGRNGYVFTIPERRAKVELLVNGIPATGMQSGVPVTALEFRITDEQGNRYLFAGGDYGYENVQDKYGYEQNIGWYNYYKSWVIKKVTTVSGAEINYYYSDINHSAPYKQYSAVEPGPPNGPGGSPYNDLTVYKRLDSIAYPNKITAYFKFDANESLDDGTGALREIQLQSGNTPQLRYLMDQAYFVASDLDSNEAHYGQTEIPYATTAGGNTKKNYRLKLKGIRIQGQTGPAETFYTFTYDPLLLPKRFNGSQDYYGYYNGKVPTQYNTGASPDQELSIPDHQPFYSGGVPFPWYGVNKSPDINYLKACILTHIRNAYGGQVQFLYDQHVLNAVLTTTNTPNLPTGDNDFMGYYAYDGLRLQAIIEKDTFHVENFKKTTFTYADGQLFLNGGYFNYPSMLWESDHTIKRKLMGNQYVSRHQFVGGANHGYSTVTVTQVDNNNNQLSRTLYNFTNFKEANGNPRYLRCGAGSLYFFQFPFAEKQFLRDWEMGLPVSVKEYDQNDRITLETTHTYAFALDTTSSLGNIENNRITEVKTDYVPSQQHSLPHTVIYTDSYRPFRGKAHLTTTTVKKYITDNNYVSDMVTYRYDSRNNLVYTLVKNSKGEYFKSENIYNYNLSIPTGTPLRAFTDAGLQKLVSTQRWKTESTGTAFIRLMDGFISTFDYAAQQVKAKAMYTFIPGDSVSRNQYTGYSGTGTEPNPHGKIIQAFAGNTPALFRKASEVLLSDAKGNPLESRIGDQDQYKAMIWDNVTGKKLAEAGNCRYNDIAYCGFESGPDGQSLIITAGNLTYNQLHVVAIPAQGSVYGAAFRLTNVIGGDKVEGTQNLSTGTAYMLSFWAMGGSPALSCGGTPVTLPAASATYANWSYYTLRFTPSVAGKLKIATPGSGTVYIDEVRLHPFTAQMQSWNYSPMFGAATSTDVNGRITFVEYDGQGRQEIVRDKDGNILSKTEYGIQ